MSLDADRWGCACKFTGPLLEIPVVAIPLSEQVTTIESRNWYSGSVAQAVWPDCWSLRTPCSAARPPCAPGRIPCLRVAWGSRRPGRSTGGGVDPERCQVGATAVRHAPFRSGSPELGSRRARAPPMRRWAQRPMSRVQRRFGGPGRDPSKMLWISAAKLPPNLELDMKSGQR